MTFYSLLWGLKDLLFSTLRHERPFIAHFEALILKDILFLSLRLQDLLCLNLSLQWPFILYSEAWGTSYSLLWNIQDLLFFILRLQGLLSSTLRHPRPLIPYSETLRTFSSPSLRHKDLFYSLCSLQTFYSLLWVMKDPFISLIKTSILIFPTLRHETLPLSLTYSPMTSYSLFWGILIHSFLISCYIKPLSPLFSTFLSSLTLEAPRPQFLPTYERPSFSSTYS